MARGLLSRLGLLQGRESLAVRVLLRSGHALDTYTGPAGLISADAPPRLNPIAAKLESSFGADGPLAEMIASARQNGQPQNEMLALTNKGAGGEETFDLTAIPLDEGPDVLVLGRDATRDRALREALIDSRSRYKDLVEVSSDFAWETDAEGRFVFVSPQGALGYNADELLALPPGALVADSEVNPFVGLSEEVETDCWAQTASGDPALIRITARPIADTDGNFAGNRGICRDITPEYRANAALAAAEQREAQVHRLVRALRDGTSPRDGLDAARGVIERALGARVSVYRSDEKAGFVRLSPMGMDDRPPAIEEVLETLAEITAGMDADRAIDRGALQAVSSDKSIAALAIPHQQRTVGALVLAAPDGEATPIAGDGDVLNDFVDQLGIAIEQVLYHDRLESLARTDELTGLLNRRAFLQDIALRHARAGGAASGALVYVDLDNFKAVNDVHGHQKGDEALIALARLLEGNSRPADLVARLGGDEFALWLDRTDAAIAEKRAADLITASEVLRTYSGAPDKPLGISVGVAVALPEQPESLDQLTARADEAMYRIKHDGKGGYVIADPPGPSNRDDSATGASA